MSREAMERALDVLKDYPTQEGEPDDICEAISALRAALAESARAEPVDSTGGTLVEQIAEAKRDMAQWPQWMQDAAHVSAAFAHPPARQAESVVNQQLTTELSDEEIQRIWDDTDEAPTFSQTLVAFARRVRAAMGKE